MKTIILCGGRGMRLHEETEFKPKPMVRVGEYPILLHIMNIYAHYGHKEFILCLGYKGEMIKDYFLTLSRYGEDFSFDMETGRVQGMTDNQFYDYKITFVETGQDTKQSGRILKALKYVNDEHFMVTYGDGVADIDINALIDFHMKKEHEHGALGTITVITPKSKFGKISLNENHLVTSFEEHKRSEDDFINAGFHIYNRKVIPYLEHHEELFESLPKLAGDMKLASFKHEGFWHCMDTMQDYKNLNSMWHEGGRPWAVWAEKEAEENKETKK